MKTRNETDRLIESVKHIHMIGIGGSGMCPLAEILHSKGYILTGSDNNESDPLKRIRKLGIQVHMGHAASNIDGAELIVYSAAISQDNPELVAAREKNIPAIERSYLLGALTRRFDQVVGVCGTHGKTTVTSMLTQILIMAAFDPTAVIGGRLPLIDSNGIAGGSDIMVCEACEFVDTFLKLSPDIAVLLNIDNDHLDYFGTMENLTASFHKFVRMAGKAVVCNGDDPLVEKAVAGTPGEKITFGMKKSNRYYAENILPGPIGMEFDLMETGKKILHITLPIPGSHNVYNAMAAAAAALYLGVEPQQIAKALSCFHGAGRRFEILGRFDGIILADDYAHHPTELKATLTAAKNMECNRVIAIFQPFTFSRTALLMDDFVDALSIADQVVLTPIMGSREKNTYGVSSEQIAAQLPACTCLATFQEVTDYILSVAKTGDLIITMGGGDIYKAAYMIRERMQARQR